MQSKQLKILSVTEYNFIANKDPRGSYDQKTRDHLYEIIKKLDLKKSLLSPLEARLRHKFLKANFSSIKEREKQVKRAVARYHLSRRAKKALKLAAASFAFTLVAGYLVYEFALDQASRQKVDLAYYTGLSKIGLDANADITKIKKDLKVASIKLEQAQRDKEKFKQDKEKVEQDLSATSSELEKAREEKIKLTQVVETMIFNNKVTENLKYIIRQIYDDPGTRYIRENDNVALFFNDKEISSYSTDPNKWYLLGIIDLGITRVIYNDQEILEIETIFGRKGEETPLGEYEIINRLNKPTWYKKETIDGHTRVRAIPFGDPDHEIGHWWMGLKKLGKPVSGSYGIHGVNASKANDFYKKNFDWRNGSAGCLNIQRWFLDFLANTVPLGTKINIVQKDKSQKSKDISSPSAA